MSQKIIVKVEYCGVCDYLRHCNDLADKLRQVSDDIDVTCNRGRQGSFEVIINDVPVYSKIRTMALPNYEAVVSAVRVASEGGPIVPVTRSQPVNCVIS